MTDSFVRDYLPVIAALAGVVVGFSLNVVRDAIRDRALKRRLASALLAEAVALRDRYWEVFGAYISQWQPGQPLDKLGAVARDQDFFAVYHGNTDKLGMFETDDLRIIVRAYTLGKAHVESLRQAADLLAKRADHIVQLASSSHPGAHQLSSQLPQLQKEIGEQLKKGSDETLRATDEMIHILARYAGQTEPRKRAIDV